MAMQNELLPEQLLSEAIRLTTLAHPPSSPGGAASRLYSAPQDEPGAPRKPSSSEMLSEALRLTTLAHQFSAELGGRAHRDVCARRTRPDVPWGRSFALEGSDDQQNAIGSDSPVDFPVELPLAGQATMRPGSVVWQVTEPPPKSELLAPQLATPRTREEGKHSPTKADTRAVLLHRGPGKSAGGPLFKDGLDAGQTQELAYYITDEALGRSLFANEDTVSALNAIRRLIVDGQGRRQPWQSLHALSAIGGPATSMGILVHGQKEIGLQETAVHPPATGGMPPQVSGVVTGSPADRSGVRAGDILVAIDGISVHDGNVMQLLHSSDLIGTTSSVTVQRTHERLDIQVARTASTSLRRMQDLLNVVECQQIWGKGGVTQIESPKISAVRSCIIEHELQRQGEELGLAERLNSLQMEVLQLVSKCASSLFVTGSALSSDGIENMFASQLALASRTISNLEEQCRVRAQEAIGLWQQLSQEREEHLRQRSDCERLMRQVTLLQSELVNKQQMLDELDDKSKRQRKETKELQRLLDGSVGKEDVQVYRDEILRLHGIIERISDGEKDVESTLQSLREEYEAQKASIAIFQSRLKHQEDIILEKVQRIEFMEEERQQNLKHSSTVELNLQKCEDKLLKTQDLRDAAEQRTRDTQRVYDTLVQRVEELTAKIHVLEHERELLCRKDDVIKAEQAVVPAQNELAELQVLLQSAGLGERAVLIDLVSVMREAMVCGTVSDPARLVRLVRMMNEGALPPLEEIFQIFNFAVGGEEDSCLPAVLDETDREQNSDDTDLSRTDGAGVFVEMELDFAISDEVAFKKALVNDVAFAVGGRGDRIHVRKLEVGSVMVHVQLLPGVAGAGEAQEQRTDGAGKQHDAEAAAEDLLKQAADPSSALKRGRWTSKITLRLMGAGHIALPGPANVVGSGMRKRGRGEGEDVEEGPFGWRAQDVKGFLMEAKGLVISQLKSRLNGQLLLGPVQACEQLRRLLDEEDLTTSSLQNELRFFSAENADLREEVHQLSEMMRTLRTPPAPQLLPFGGVFTEDQKVRVICSSPDASIFVNVVEVPGGGDREVRQNLAIPEPGPQQYTYSGSGPQLTFTISETSIVTAKAAVQDSPLSQSSFAYFVRITSRADQDTGHQGRAGVGMVLHEESDYEDIFIKSLSENGPAQQSGQIHERDILLKVDGHDVAGLGLPDVAELIAGEPGSTVELELLHGASQDPSKNQPVFRKVVLMRQIAPYSPTVAPQKPRGRSERFVEKSFSTNRFSPSTLPEERSRLHGSEGGEDGNNWVDSPPGVFITI